MARLLVCLPICLFVVPSYPGLSLSPEEFTPLPVHAERTIPSEGILALGAQPTLPFPANLSWMGLWLLGQRNDSPKQAAALLAFGPSGFFPGAVNWAALHLATKHQAGIDLIRPDGDPVVFLEKCLERYGREVRGYTLTMRKQEKVGDKKPKTELVEVKFQEKPFSVYFHWLQGAGLAKRTLYVEGKNDGMMLVLTFIGVKPLDPENDPLVKSSSRYPITEFGFKRATERVYRGWKKAQEEGTLHVEYLGLQKVPETGDRWCYVLRRTKYARVPEDKVTNLTLFFDRDNWLQVGSVLLDKDGHLIGEYYFRDVRLNPDFPPDHFEPAGLKK